MGDRKGVLSPRDSHYLGFYEKRLASQARDLELARQESEKCRQANIALVEEIARISGRNNRQANGPSKANELRAMVTLSEASTRWRMGDLTKKIGECDTALRSAEKTVDMLAEELEEAKAQKTEGDYKYLYEKARSETNTLKARIRQALGEHDSLG